MSNATQYKIAGIIWLAAAIIRSYLGEGLVWLCFIIGAMCIGIGCYSASTVKKMEKFIDDNMDNFIDHYNNNKNRT